MATNLDISAGYGDAQTTFMEGHTEFFTGATLEGPYTAWTQIIRNIGNTSLQWLANLPRTQRWVHPFPKKGMRHYSYTALPVSYKADLLIRRLDLVRDKLGTTMGTIGNWLARETDAHHVAVTTSMDSNSGAGETGYDGVAMFHASHPHLNSGAGASNISTALFSHSNYIAARAAGRSITDEGGVPMQIQYTDLRVGPELEDDARQVTDANLVVRHYNSAGVETSSAGAVKNSPVVDNIHRGEVVLHVDDYQTSSTYWDLMDLSKGDNNRPMLLVVERDLEPYPNPMDMGAERRRERDEFVFGHDGEWLAKPAVSILAYRGGT